jgi:hypothetical protein
MVYLLLYGGNQTQLLIGGSLLASKKAPPNKVKTPYRDADEIMQCYYSIMLSVLNHRKRSINIYIYYIEYYTIPVLFNYILIPWFNFRCPGLFYAIRSTAED